MALTSDAKSMFVNGDQYLVKQGTFTMSIGGKTNTPVLTSEEMIGTTGQAVPGTISATLALPAGKDLNDFVVLDAQIRVVFDDDSEYLMKGAANDSPPEFSGGAGDVSVSYNGKRVKKTA